MRPVIMIMSSARARTQCELCEFLRLQHPRRYFELDPVTLDSIGLFNWNHDPIDRQMLSVITSAHPSQLPGDKYL